MIHPLSPRYGRREFLVRAGVMGAALVVVEGALLTGPSAVPGPTTGAGLDSIFESLSTDTFNGLVAFVVPGPDPYSVAQGVSDTAPGGIAADATTFMLTALDDFFPIPQEPLRLLIQAATTGLTANLPGLPGFPLALELVAELDAALAALLGGLAPAPLSLLAALLLNFVATLIQPTALNGAFLSPFARLTFAEKAQVFAMLEGEAATVAGLIDGSLSEPARDSVSGVIAFLAGALAEFPAFGAYSEYGTFAPATRSLSATPVGWSLSRYLALAPQNRPVEGWDEFKGYLGGVSQASP